MESASNEYQYNYTYVPPLAMAESVPRSQKPTLDWYWKVAVQAFAIAKNRLRWRPSSAAPAAVDESADDAPLTVNLDHLGLPPIDLRRVPTEPAAVEALRRIGPGGQAKDLGDAAPTAPDPKLLGDILGFARKILELGILDPLEALGALLKGILQGPTGRPSSIADYRGLFTTLPVPWVAQSYADDATFAWLRVAGFNPLVIARADGKDPAFPVTDAMLAAATGEAGDTLAAAVKEDRLYVADYRALAEVQNGNFPDGSKYGFAPKALFALPRGQGARRLRPVAIQCGQDPRSYPIFTPGDGDAWLKAKTVVECADGNYHELISHLARTHLVIEPIVVATHRRLKDGHAVSQLIRPHFEGTLSINDAAQRTLITAGHQVDQVMAGTIDASRTVAVQGLLSYRFNEAFLPASLEARGVTSPDLDYPYRDDAQLVWKAVERWVTAYVENFYASDEAVRSDNDLQAWGAEIVAEDGGRLRGFGAGGTGRIPDRAYLINALTMIIFTAGAQHAAVNFAQAQIMTYVPAAPGAAYRAAPLSLADAKLSPYLDLLPPLDMAMTQVEFLSLLGGVYYTKLGDYGPTAWLLHPAVRKALDRFQGELSGIGQEIAARNEKRYGPYPFLIPDQIPQSINI